MNPKSFIKLALMYGSSVIHPDHGSRILYYHDVYSSVNYKALDADLQMGTPLEIFKKHIDIICKEGFDIVDRINRPEGQVAIMFDDGFRGIWECRDFFFQHQIHPTIFLPVEYIGQTEKGILSVNEILELQQHGFSFQSHGWTHRPLTSVPSNEMERELTGSRIYLSQLLGREVSSLCMPLGYYNQALLDLIREAGYKDIYSCIPGSSNTHPLGMNNRNLCQYASPLELKLTLRGGSDMFAGRYLKLHCKPQ